jgi:hypothetical protein
VAIEAGQGFRHTGTLSIPKLALMSYRVRVQHPQSRDAGGRGAIAGGGAGHRTGSGTLQLPKSATTTPLVVYSRAARRQNWTDGRLPTSRSRHRLHRARCRWAGAEIPMSPGRPRRRPKS